MKIYISSDIEGVSGVVTGRFTNYGKEDYNRARELMTNEVNAVIKGLFNSGVKDITVNDSHGPMTNLLIEKIDQNINLISGYLKNKGMMQGLDSSYDGVILTGYHSRNNEEGSFSHTYFGSVVNEIRINSVPVGEFEFNTMYANYLGVPVIQVTGDQHLEKQVKAYDSVIKFSRVKESYTRFCAKCLPPTRVHELMQKNAIEAIDSLKNNDFKQKNEENNYVLEIRYNNNGLADAANCIPGVEKIDGVTLRYESSNFDDIYKMRGALITLGGSAL